MRLRGKIFTNLLAFILLGFAHSGQAFAMGAGFPSNIYNYGTDDTCTGLTYNSSLSFSDPCYSEWAAEVLLHPTDPGIAQLAAQLTQGQTATADKIIAIHDWVLQNIRYDTAAYTNNTATAAQQDALVVLSTRTGVCEGFSSLTASLLLAAGIPAKMVTGTDLQESPPVACGHEWNKAQLDANTWIAIDVTFDATYGRSYLDPDPTFFAQTHTECNESSGQMSAPASSAF